MGWTVYTSALSIRVKHDTDNERERVQELNKRFAEVEKEFDDLNLMLFGFDEKDFLGEDDP